MIQMLLVACMLTASLHGMEKVKFALLGPKMVKDALDHRQELREDLERIPKDFAGLSEVRKKYYQERRQELEQDLLQNAQDIKDAEKYQEDEAAGVPYKDLKPVGFRRAIQPSVASDSTDRAEVKQEASQRAEAKSEADAKEQNAEQREPKPHKFSLHEYRVREAFKQRLIAGCKKSDIYRKLENGIILQGNNSNNHFEIREGDMNDGLTLFFNTYSDIVFTALQKNDQELQQELRQQCRGGAAGQCAYNFYNPAWRQALEKRYHDKLSVELLVTEAYSACMREHKNDVRLVMIFGCIKDCLSARNHEQAHLLLFEAQVAYRTGFHKYFYSFQRNPRRVVFGVVVVAALAYAAYRRWYNDYY